MADWKEKEQSQRCVHPVRFLHALTPAVALWSLFFARRFAFLLFSAPGPPFTEPWIPFIWPFASTIPVSWV